jgi:hypothetical protein
MQMFNPKPITKDYVHKMMYMQRDDSMAEKKIIRHTHREVHEERKEAPEDIRLTKSALEQNSSSKSSLNPFIMKHRDSNFGSKTM